MPVTSSVLQPASSTAASAASSSGQVTGQVSAQEQSDRFLKLLVAQLNNQDPMNPLDNAEMTSQIAQINTVSGIQQVNDNLKSMVGQFNAMQVMQGSGMIGRAVLAPGDTLPVTAGSAQGGFNLNGDATQVTVEVYNSAGQRIGSENLGPLKSGLHNYAWDASAYTGTGAPTFKVLATNGNQPVTADTLTRDKVTSVNAGADGVSVTLANGSTVRYDSIKTIL